MSTDISLPSLPLSEWAETKTTLHILAQIVGKIRLGLSPKLNHWWHAPLYVSARGLTTSAIPYGKTDFDMELDLTDHQLVIRSSDGEIRKVQFENHTIAQFYRELFFSLGSLGIDAPILAKPFDPSKVKSEEPSQATKRTPRTTGNTPIVSGASWYRWTASSRNSAGASSGSVVRFTSSGTASTWR